MTDRDDARAALSRGDGLALWRQIAETLNSEIIKNGRTSADRRLPTEKALAERFGVNRHTVRRAMAVLQNRGVIRVEQGRGTFIQPHVLDYPIGKRTRFSENIRRQQVDPSGELLRLEEVEASAALAADLGVPAGAPLILLEKIGKADGTPLSVASHYFSRRRFPTLMTVLRHETSVTAALAACGVADYTRKVTRVTARLPTPTEARLLGLSRTRPVLVTESLNVDIDGQPLEVGIARLASDRVQLVFET